MADVIKYDYETINRPYNDYMQRSQTPEIPTSVDTGNENIDMLKPVKNGQALENLWINSWIKSSNYQPKTQGFFIDGQAGYMELMNLYVKGGISAGKIDVPDTTTTNSFHVDTAGNTWWGANEAAGYVAANAYILNDGTSKFKKIVIDGSAGAGNAQFISDTLDTSSKKILSDFNFGAVNYAGALKTGTISWNTSTGGSVTGSGVAVYRKGIVGANAGVVTFSIDATTGNATFKGDITGSTGTFGSVIINSGTISWSTVSGTANAPADNATVGATLGVNVSGGSTSANYVNNSGYVTNITADAITSGTITGRTLQTSASSYTGVKIGPDYGGITSYGQAMYFNNGSTQYGYIYATTYSFPGFSGNALAFIGSPYDVYVASSNRIWMGGQFLCPQDDNYEYLGCSTTSYGGGQAQDKTWKYIGGQFIDAKDRYLINNITCIDQAGSDVYFTANYSNVYIQGSPGTNDARFSASGNQLYHDTTINGTLTSTSDHITINGTAYYGTTGAYNSGKYYLRNL